MITRVQMGVLQGVPEGATRKAQQAALDSLMLEVRTKVPEVATTKVHVVVPLPAPERVILTRALTVVPQGALQGASRRVCLAARPLAVKPERVPRVTTETVQRGVLQGVQPAGVTFRALSPAPLVVATKGVLPGLAARGEVRQEVRQEADRPAAMVAQRGTEVIRRVLQAVRLEVRTRARKAVMQVLNGLFIVSIGDNN